jgi:general secretion pathway protein G
LQKPTVPADPWGSPYLYRYPGQHGGEFDLYSLGADKAEGGTGEN